MRTIRVFPRRTSLTPTDDYAFVGQPPLLRPEADEVHVSVAFTWDIEEARLLASAWSQYYPVVKIGGPALDAEADGFAPGMYLRQGVTITSRGCNRKCPWCLVPQREGRIRLLPIQAGHIVQDNNLLQTGQDHMIKVFEMLKQQRKSAVFSGGLDARLIDDWVAAQLSALRIDQLFLAADVNAMMPVLKRAVEKLGFLSRKKLRCYVLIGRGDTLDETRQRLEEVWQIGCMPFAQLFQPPDNYIEYERPWRLLAREWSRPAAMMANHKMEAPK